MSGSLLPCETSRASIHLFKNGSSRPFERFATTGEGDVIRLKGIEPPEWRLRVGKWRVRFRQNPRAQTLQVLRVLLRDRAY